MPLPILSHKRFGFRVAAATAAAAAWAVLRTNEPLNVIIITPQVIIIVLANFAEDQTNLRELNFILNSLGNITV